MTLEEIWDNITILNNYTTINTALLRGCLGILAILTLVVITIKDYRINYYTSNLLIGIITAFGVAALTVNSFWFYTCQPHSIKLQITANVEMVSSEQLAEYFEMSDISLGNGQIICDIKPKFDCYNEALELLEDSDI